MKNKLVFLIFILCLVLGAILRLQNIATYPPSLNWDEVSLGYNAYSLLHTAHDEWNVFFPAIFRAFGDYKLPLYVYTTVPSVAFFGLNPLGVRLPSVIAGIGLIILSFLLASRLFKNRTIAVLSAFLVTTQPWTVFLSRIAVEANLAAFFITLGVYLGITKRYSLAAFFLGLSVWTYNSARFFVPALLLFIVIYFRHRLKTLLLPLFISAVFILPMFFQMFQPSGQARLGWLTILDSGAISQIESSRAASKFIYPKLLHNKVTYFSSHFITNYFSYFSPGFLFFRGGSQYQFNIPGLGLLSPVCLIFFYLGVLFLVFSKEKSHRLILLWLFLAPIAGSVTRDSPHTLRAVTMLPLPMLITSFGLIKSSKFVPLLKFMLIWLFGIGIVYSFWQFSVAYIYTYPKSYSWSWQYGYPQVIAYITSNYSLYDQIIFTKKYGEPHEFVLFYTPWNPDRYSTDSKLVRYFKSDWYWVDSFAKFRFVNDWEMPSYVKSLSISGNYLIISGPDNPVSASTINQINFLDGKPAFIISQKVI